MTPNRHALSGPGIAALLSLGLAFTYALLAREPGAVFLLGLDDGYIHARLAENLVATGVLGLDPGVGGGGSSSLAWTLLISSLVALGFPGDLAAGGLSLISLAFAVAVASRLFFDLLPPRQAWVASIAVAGGGQTAALALTGMESLLFAGLILAGFRDAIGGRRGDGTLFFCLAATVRVEAILAAGCCWAVRAMTEARSLRGRPDWRRLSGSTLQWLAVVAAAAAAAGLLAWLGHGSPSTLAARRWLYRMGESLIPGTEQLATQVPYLLGDLWTRWCSFHGPGGIAGLVWGLVMAALLAVGSLEALRARGPLAAVPIYFVVQTAFVVLVVGSDSHLSRYLAGLWMLAPLLVVLGWGQLTDSISRPALQRLGTAAAVVLLALYVPQAYHWAIWHRASVAHLRDVHLAMAEAVSEFVPANEPVAAFDVGLLAYRGGRRVVDMGGITDERMLRALWRGQTPVVLARLGVRYVILPEGVDSRVRHFYADRLGFDPRRLGPPGLRASVKTKDLSYLGPTKVAMPALALYRLR